MEVKRNFSINLIFLLAANLLIKPAYLFGIEVGVQNTVGAADYGLYYAMFNFTFLFNVLLDLGINNFQKIKVAQNAAEGMQNMALMLPMKIILSLAYVAATAIAALILGFDERNWFFILWLMLNHVLSVMLLTLRANISGLHLFMRDSILSITDRLFLIVVLGYLLWFSNDAFRIETFVYLQTVAYGIALIVAFAMTPRGMRIIKPNFNISAMLDMAKKTWPYALLILLMTAYNKMDGIMLERMALKGAEEAGIYAQAYRLLDAGNSFAFLYAGLLLPMFARILTQDENHKQLALLTDQAARYLIIPAGAALLIVNAHSDFIMGLLYRAHVHQSARILELLMGSFVFIASGYVFGTLITASQHMKWLNKVALLTVVLNFVLNVWLIPEKGAEGAALASLLSLGVMAIWQATFAIRKFTLNFASWLWRAMLVWAITGVTIWLTNSAGLASHWSIVTCTLLTGIAFLGLGIKRQT